MSATFVLVGPRPPYPPHSLVERGRMSGFEALGLPTGYILAEDDRTIEPPTAARFAERLPKMPDGQRARWP